MKIKQFFASNTFKSLAVLLAIAILSGGLLAILSDLFRVDTTEEVLPFEPFINLEESTIASRGNAVEFSLQIKANPPAPSFRVHLTVTDGEITNYYHEGNFATGEAFASKVDHAVRDYSKFIGMKIQHLNGVISESGSLNLDAAQISSGATYSSQSFYFAAAFALYNYPHYLGETT